MCKRLIFIFTVLLSSLPLMAQVSVSAQFDSVALFIGEQTKLTLQADQPQGEFVQFPILSDTVVSGLEIVEMPKYDTAILDDGTMRVAANYLVTSFDSALFYIDGLEFVYEGDTLISNPLSLKVIDMPVDTTQNAITDIKGVYNPPFDWQYFWTVVMMVVMGLLIIALIVWGVIYYRRHRKVAEEVVAEEVDPRTAYEIAMQELDEIRQRKLCENGQFKLYYTLITDVLRLYVKRRFSIDAMELTSDELLSAFRTELKLGHYGKDDSYDLLCKVLQLSDLVKFAKWQPLPDENHTAFNQIIEFLNITKLDEVQENAPDADANTLNK